MTPSPVPQSPWFIKEKISGYAIWSDNMAIGIILKQYENSKENTELIVKAVNNYAPMLELLREIYKVTGYFTRDGKYLGDPKQLWIYEKVKALLASLEVSK